MTGILQPTGDFKADAGALELLLEAIHFGWDTNGNAELLHGPDAGDPADPDPMRYGASAAVAVREVWLECVEPARRVPAALTGSLYLTALNSLIAKYKGEQGNTAAAVGAFIGRAASETTYW